MSQNQKQEVKKKKKDEVKQLEEHSGSQSDQADQYERDSYESSFIQKSQLSGGQQIPFRGQLPAHQENDKLKSKKEKKKDKKERKERRKRKHSKEDSFDQGDLDVIDDDDRRYSRLKKKKESIRESDNDYDQEEQEQIDAMDQHYQDRDQEDNLDYGLIQKSDDSISEIQEIVQVNKDIFQPGDLKKLTIEEEDKEIIDTDLPERYFLQLKSFSKSMKKPIAEIRNTLQTQDKSLQSQWIYKKLKASSSNMAQCQDQKDLKHGIKKVLQCMHRENLDIMYIYNYRKKIYLDLISLQTLWKIYELDEQWMIFREKQKKIIVLLQELLPSYMEVPKELVDMIRHCTDQRQLKYFQDYQQFVMAKWANLNTHHAKDKQSIRQHKYSFITQVSERRVAEELESSQIFLSPQNLCHNLIKRLQDRKPKTPHAEPKDQFERILKSQNPQHDKLRYPLLTPEYRFKTITKYLCYQLFTYPELRKILRQKYYKKLVIGTTATKKGNQQIDLYNPYFPVKRIKDKPIATLRREIWILALQAQKLDLIKIDLKFEWQLNAADKTSQRESRERDLIYLDIVKCYYDVSSHRSGELWNLFRKQIISRMLEEYFFPSFMKEVREELTKEGEKDIINACCQTLKHYLFKSSSLKEGKPIKILSMVLEETKLGIAFVDQVGKSLFSYKVTISNDEELKQFVSDQNLSFYIKQYKPDMILIAANCKRAQNLRKQLRNPNLFNESIFCAFGQYQIARLVAKKQIIQGIVEQQSILEAVSMARHKKNPMSQIISLWNDRVQQNGILSMNLHQYQSYIDQKRLKNSLQKVIIQVVNLVGLDLNELSKNQHIQNQIQFVSGLGFRKAFVFIQKLKEQSTEIINRKKIQELVRGKVVNKNCAPFFKVETALHKALFQKCQKEKKSTAIKQYEQINLLDMTRIPQEWYPSITRKILQIHKPNSISDIRSRKQFSKLSDDNMALFQIFKNPQKIRAIEWKVKDNTYFDEELVKAEIMSRFKNPRDPQRVMENKEIFFNLLRETPQTFKRYMIMPVKVLSIKKNYLNVIIPQNGLFGYIKLQTSKSQQQLQKIYQKGNTIKAIVIGFPFDQKAFRDQISQQQQLLKIQMSLQYPHKDNDRHQGLKHDCMSICFPSIVKQIHPLIDLDKERFELRKEDRPVIEVREEKAMSKNVKTEYRRISHPKFKNISAGPAIEMMKSQQIGQFVIRPSSQGPEYLTITWNFFKDVVVHIKVRCEYKGINNFSITYRIEDRENRTYISLEEIIQKHIKPMNLLVQDVTSNKKFMNVHIEQIQDRVKKDMLNDSSHIYYYFSTSQQYPQYFLLIYMYKQKKPIRELVKVKSNGLYFHQQQFSNIRDLIMWFKEHLKEKEYQKYAKSMNAAMKK